MNAVTTTNTGEIMESVLLKGDLGKLDPAERSRYYLQVCASLGLNPLTQPLQYVTLNNKLQLYATRTCTDQLRAIHKVSVISLTEEERENIIIVTAKVANAEGRTDMAKGAVSLAGLKGEALANAIMKAETKAKRRATLSFCGLGLLDDTEVDSIPGAVRQDGEVISSEQAEHLRTLAEEVGADVEKFCRYMKAESIPDIPASKYERAVQALEARRGK